MSNSFLHDLLTDIRKRYSGKEMSILDIRDIEEKYRMCSVANFRFDNCAFLRITSFGSGEVTFEDIVINSKMLENYSEDLLFNAQRILYELAYGIKLSSENKRFLEGKIEPPPYEFETIRDELDKLRKRCNDLEKKLESTTSRPDQISLFDDHD